MVVCVRCGARRRVSSMVPGRRHCRKCQRAASRLSYFRSRLSVLEYKARVRALLYGCRVEVVDYSLIYRNHINTPCLLCGLSLNGRVPLEFHHIVDLRQGGDHSFSNVTLVHRPCNRGSSARLYLLREVL